MSDPALSQDQDQALVRIVALREAARAAGHRRLVVLAGDPVWCRALAEAALAALGGAERIWVGAPEAAVKPVLPTSKARQLLGGELELAVFDAYAGFDPDAFGALSGALRGGGLLILLAPPLQAWPRFADPERARIAVAPHGPEAVGGRFLARLAGVLRADPTVLLIEEGAPVPPLPVAAPAPPAEPGPDQAAAVEAVLRVALGHRRRPLVLLADRGRGKSAAFGMAAAELIRRGRSVIVTAPRREAAQTLFAHAAAGLPDVRQGGGALVQGDASLSFAAPDELAATPRPADLLLVDEAAGIPTPLLSRLLQRYSRIAFSSTVHGYEGTGRGFALRFQRELTERTPGWRLLRLACPIRWREGDPLERLTFDALLLDAEAAPEAEVAPARPQNLEIRRVSRDGLVADEESLREVFGLLVLAHYRTRPFDLRHLLDGPNLEIWLARVAGRVAAVAVVADEGGLEAGLAEAVRRGERRARGHLIPQSLAAHLGLAEAPGLRCARVMRIAVHPACQGRGIGTALLRRIAAAAAEAGVDLLGSSFGGTAELLRFWQRAGCAPVRVGVTREAMSGEHAVMVLRALTPAGSGVCAAAAAHFRDNFPFQLGEPLADLDPELVLALMPAPAGARLSEEAPAREFAAGGRSYEDALAALWNLAAAAAGEGAADAAARRLLVLKVLQRRSWEETARLIGASGRAEVLAALRRAVSAALGAARS